MPGVGKPDLPVPESRWAYVSQGTVGRRFLREKDSEYVRKDARRSYGRVEERDGCDTDRRGT